MSNMKYKDSNEIFDYKAWGRERTEKNREEKGYRIEESQFKRSPYITSNHISEKRLLVTTKKNITTSQVTGKKGGGKRCENDTEM